MTKRKRRSEKKSHPAPLSQDSRLNPFGKALLVGLLVLYAAALFAHKIDLVSADLGRHIKNGALFFESWRPLDSNYYSYTEPDRPTINHHWGAGVVFFGVWKCAGFDGLTVFYVLIHVAAVCLLLSSSTRHAGFATALLLCLVNLPLLAFRPEIRPEGFSYLFLAAYYSLLWGVLDERIPARWLWLIPVLQIFWTNIHIFFCFGPFLVAMATIDAGRQKKGHLGPTYRWVLAATCAVCFLNPFGLAGVLEPLTIFRSYGYEVAENQTVLELQRSYTLPVLVQFELVAALAAALCAWLLLKRETRRIAGARVLVLLFFGLVAWRVGRAVALFGLLAIPVGALGVQLLLERRGPTARQRFDRGAMLASGALLLAPLVLPNAYLSPFSRPLGIGLAPQVQDSAGFFRENGLRGPIFNDYDIGGYLIYHLFPREKVFVDNRPEAYSVSFFRDTYIPMQKDEALWRDMEKKFHFNVIYFSRRDRTPWAKPFLVRRIRDRSWAPVYADPYSVILLKRNEVNRDLIDRFEPS